LGIVDFKELPFFLNASNCKIYSFYFIFFSFFLLFFLQRRDVADFLARKMTAEGHKVVALHGQHAAADRDTVMDSFRSGNSKVLITTNVLARGIDILQVNLVVNYDLPLDMNNQVDTETYLHRIGRTGRFGRTGVSINFVHDRKSYEEMKQIENHFGKEIIRVPTEDWREVEKLLKKITK